MPNRPPRFKPRHAPTDAQAERARQRVLDRRRGSPTERGYDAEWRKKRREILTSHPFCEVCGATDRLEVDHIKSIREAPHLRLVDSNLRVLCKPCHSRRTASEQGFGVSVKKKAR